MLGVLLIAFCVPRLAKLYHRDGAELFTLMVLNPVTIFHLIGGAHNDALMLGLLVAGLTLAKEKRPLLGHRPRRPRHRGQGAGGPGHPLHRVELAGPGVPIRDRVRPVVTAGLVGSRHPRLLLYVSGLGLGLGHDPGARRAWSVVGFADHRRSPSASPASPIWPTSGWASGGVLTVTRFLGLAISAVAGVWLLLNSDRIGTLKALGS